MEKTFEFSENVVGFMVNKEIGQKKMEEILSKIKARLQKVSPICLYLEDESDEGISIGGFLKAVEFHFSHSRDLEKIAIVTDDELFKKSMEMKDLFVPAEVKSFKRKDRVEAMNWVMI
ncbi:STAS/SEC14 domain-containing protein [Salegentibacter sp. JZCK2]|uniref:STAS/SEC14 domain-containing protein n=1 Tax=Salegentibacter tibetensis TaxID=2873600 RepID=UPI001CCB8AB0|nr:STAS/SEC14 domain-containing protein [Salegentibacter tibetensis]MBZ9730859.1 STAS/SEC14 domain-containing protein [Salegentibacter tibetensis]